jgi:hypothetical protein
MHWCVKYIYLRKLDESIDATSKIFKLLYAYDNPHELIIF